MAAFTFATRFLASAQPRLLPFPLFSHLRSWRNTRNQCLMSTSTGQKTALVHDESEMSQDPDAMIAKQRCAIRELELQLVKAKAASALFEELAKEKEKDLDASTRRLMEEEKVIVAGNRFESSLRVENVKLAASFATFKSKYCPVTNILPVIEVEVRDWYRRNDPSSKFFTSEEALNAFVDLVSSNDPYDENDKVRLKKSIDKAAVLGQIAHGDKYLIEHELRIFFDKVFPDMHNIEEMFLGNLGPGFVYGDEKFVTAAASVFLIYFNYSHTAMSRRYQEVRYLFDAEEDESGGKITLSLIG